MMDIEKFMLLWFINFLIKKKTKAVVLIIKLNKNEQLAEELGKSIIRKFKKEEFFFT